MRRILIAIGMALLAGAAGEATAQSIEGDGPAPELGTLNLEDLTLNIDMSARWTIRATGSVWFPSLNGEQVLRGGPKFDIDIVDQPDVQIAPRYELAFRRDRWTLITSGFRFNIDQSATVQDEPLISGPTTLNPGDEVNYRIEYWSFDLIAAYRLMEVPLDNLSGRGPAIDPFQVPQDGVGLFFDVLGGARVWHLDYTMDEIGGSNLIDQRSTWVDPLLGMRMLLDLPYGYGLELRGDVGGFGLGSEFAWNVEVSFQTQITENIGAEIGFRHLQTRYESGSGADRFEWDVAIAGLYGSVLIRF